MEIRVALIGVGNSASALIQGLKTYEDDDKRPGLWHRVIGGHKVGEIEIVGAFDIDSKKIGRDLADVALKSSKISHRKLGVKIKKGLLLDELSEFLRNHIHISNTGYKEFVRELRVCRPSIVLNLISSGLEMTSKSYARASLSVGASFVNASPSPIASDRRLARSFASRGLVLVGDDLMSQFGGTAFHRGILSFMEKRGLRVQRTYQLDVSGSVETLNTLDDRVKALKRQIKTSSISSEVAYPIDTAAGTADYVDHLGNDRVGYFRIEAEGFLSSPATIDICLRTNDGSNAGNVLLDLIRSVKAAADLGQAGVVQEICGYGFKSPPMKTTLQAGLDSFVKKYLQSNV